MVLSFYTKHHLCAYLVSGDLWTDLWNIFNGFSILHSIASSLLLQIITNCSFFHILTSIQPPNSPRPIFCVGYPSFHGCSLACTTPVIMSSHSSPIPNDAANANTSSSSSACPLILPPEEFAQDAEQRLGRANGNTYQRRPAIENVHDGQIMVRLKKKRYIIIDYSIIPSESDIETAKDLPHVVVPEGAGERLCATRECPRIGVPVQLFDSEPNEPASLYLRGGLCFSCQRTLNEKRRTQRKRKSDTIMEAHHAVANRGLGMGIGGVGGPVAPQQQRYRLNGSILDLNPDAVIINGPIEGTRTRGPDYQYPRIGQDLLHLVSEIQRGAHTLLSTAYRNQSMGTVGSNASITQINGLFQTTFRDMSRATYLITQWKASWDENIGGNMLAAASGGIPMSAGPVGTMPMVAAMPGMHHAMNGGDFTGSMAVPQQAQLLQQQQQQQQQFNALMAPPASSSAAVTAAQVQAQAQQQQPPQAQAPSNKGGGGEEKNNYDLSDFYEEV